MIPVLVLLLGAAGAIGLTALVNRVRRRRRPLRDAVERHASDPVVGDHVREELGLYHLIGSGLLALIRWWWVTLLVLGGALALLVRSGAIPLAT